MYLHSFEITGSQRDHGNEIYMFQTPFCYESFHLQRYSLVQVSKVPPFDLSRSAVCLNPFAGRLLLALPALHILR